MIESAGIKSRWRFSSRRVYRSENPAKKRFSVFVLVSTDEALCTGERDMTATGSRLETAVSRYIEKENHTVTAKSGRLYVPAIYFKFNWTAHTAHGYSSGGVMI